MKCSNWECRRFYSFLPKLSENTWHLKQNPPLEQARIHFKEKKNHIYIEIYVTDMLLVGWSCVTMSKVKYFDWRHWVSAACTLMPRLVHSSSGPRDDVVIWYTAASPYDSNYRSAWIITSMPLHNTLIHSLRQLTTPQTPTDDMSRHIPDAGLEPGSVQVIDFLPQKF